MELEQAMSGQPALGSSSEEDRSFITPPPLSQNARIDLYRGNQGTGNCLPEACMAPGRQGGQPNLLRPISPIFDQAVALQPSLLSGGPDEQRVSPQLAQLLEAPGGLSGGAFGQ